MSAVDRSREFFEHKPQRRALVAAAATAAMLMAIGAPVATANPGAGSAGPNNNAHTGGAVTPTGKLASAVTPPRGAIASSGSPTPTVQIPTAAATVSPTPTVHLPTAAATASPTPTVHIPTAAATASPTPAQPLDMQVSIGGYDLFTYVNNTAIAQATPGNIAIAIGNNSYADAGSYWGLFNFAYANGTNTIAEADVGIFDYAAAVGANDYAKAGEGSSFDFASIIGNNSTAIAGSTAPGNFALAAVSGDMLSAFAENPGQVVTNCPSPGPCINLFGLNL